MPTYIINWTTDAYADFEKFAKTNKRLAQKIISFLLELETHPFTGTGKPEPLKYQLSGCWSRRIDVYNRLIYQVEDNNVFILAVKRHYTK